MPETVRRKVMLALPGGTFDWEMFKQSLHCSKGRHEVRAANSHYGWDDMNRVWAHGLNEADAGNLDRFVMVHSDVVPEDWFVDHLLDVMADGGYDMVSASVALKDQTSLTSCGLGDPNNTWGGAFKRFTVRELNAMPDVVTIDNFPQYPGKYLLHNTGCWAADMTRPVFRTTDADGFMIACFDFPTKVARGEDGKWIVKRESEDWFFSRKLHELGAKTAIATRVQTYHMGKMGYPNFGDWGEYKDGDENTKHLWGKVA